MSQEKAAEIIDLNASRAAAQGQSRIEKAGEFLANARQAAGLEYAAVSAGTKVKVEHLEAIEQTRPDKLPATPYAVGFVKVYARFLDLDAEAVAAQFKDDIGAAVRVPVELTPTPPSPLAPPETGEGVRLASVFGILTILIFAGWVAFKILAVDDAVEDVIIEETQPFSDPLAVLAPVPAESNDPALQRPENIEAPAAAEGDEIEIPVAAAFEILNSTADTQSIETSPIVEADAFADELSSAVSPTPEILTGPEANVPAPQQIAPAQTSLPVRKQIVVVSKLVRSVAPIYPHRCGDDAAALESVIVLFDVTAAGRLANARVVSSTNSCFEKSALKTVKRWRFEPKTVDGAARIDAGKTATLHFRK